MLVKNSTFARKDGYLPQTKRTRDRVNMKRILSLDGILYVEKALVKIACLLDKMNTYSYSAPRYEFTRDREMKKMGIPQFKMDLYLYSFSLIFMGI